MSESIHTYRNKQADKTEKIEMIYFTHCPTPQLLQGFLPSPPPNKEPGSKYVVWFTKAHAYWSVNTSFLVIQPSIRLKMSYSVSKYGI